MKRKILTGLLLLTGLVLSLPELATAQTACGYSLGSGIYNKWVQAGGEQGRLGCPEINESEAGSSPQGTTGRYARFRGGAYIIWHGSGPMAGRAFVVGGCFFNLERGEGGTRGWLGFPTSDEYDVAGGRRQDWEGGYGLWDAQTSRCRAYRNAGPVVSEGGGRQEVLTPGWDIFSLLLRSGSVVWSLTDAGGGRMRFRVTYELQGSQPNHSFQVGIHFFEPAGQRLADINEFGGWKNGGRESLTREGVTASILAAWDFGPLVTDGSGNGRASFEYLVPTATYFMQFTVRNGECNNARGITDGCPAVFRTGGKFGSGFSGNSGGRGSSAVCTPVGTWNWIESDTVVIRSDGTAVAFHSDGAMANDARWESLGGNRYRLTWRVGGWVDLVTLSGDGKFIDGQNNVDTKIHATCLTGSVSTGPNVSGGGGICDDPRTQAIMDEWLAQANPPENRQPGWSVRYESWGRLIGRSPSATLSVPYTPDTRLSRCEYLWSIAPTLRSTNLGTLRDYVEQRRR